MTQSLEQAMCAFRPTLPLGVALSGGADSCALLALCARRWPGQVVALHINHGLQSAAAEFEAHCEALCAALQVPLRTKSVKAFHAAGQSPEDAARIARYTGQDRKLAQAEIEKLSLYYDASPQRPATVDIAIFEALSAETGEENINGLVHVVMGGDLRGTGRELAAARDLGVDAIRIIRAMQRRVTMLAAMRTKVLATRSMALLSFSVTRWLETKGSTTQ